MHGSIFIRPTGFASVNWEIWVVSQIYNTDISTQGPMISLVAVDSEREKKTLSRTQLFLRDRIPTRKRKHRTRNPKGVNISKNKKKKMTKDIFSFFLLVNITGTY